MNDIVFAHASSIFSVSIICAFIMFALSFCRFRKITELTWADLCVLLFLVAYLPDSFTVYTFWNIGCLCLLLFYLSVRLMYKLNYRYIYYGVLFVLFVHTVWGYLQYVEILPGNNSYFKLTGPYHNPGILGGVMCLLLIIVIGGSFQFFSHFGRRKRMHFIVIIVIVLALPVVGLTEARASWLALVLALLYLVYMRWGRQVSRKKQMIYSLGTIVVLPFLLFFFYTLKPLSANGRVLIWKVSCQMIKDKPFTGFGKGGFEANYLYYQAAYMKEGASDAERYVADNTHFAFNEVIRVAVEHGIPGAFVYVSFFIFICLLPTRRDIVSYTIKSTIGGIVVWGLFSYPHSVFGVMALLVASLAALLNRQKKQTKACLSVVPLRVFRLLMIAVLVPLLISIYSYYQWYDRFATYRKSTSVDEAIAAPLELMRFREKLPTDMAVLTFYANVLRKQQDNKKLLEVIHTMEGLYPTPTLWIHKGDIYRKLGDMEKAEQAYQLAAAMVPTRQKARYKLSLLYLHTGRTEEAVLLARCLLSEKVKNYGFETFEMHKDLKRTFRDML